MWVLPRASFRRVQGVLRRGKVVVDGHGLGKVDVPWDWRSMIHRNGRLSSAGRGRKGMWFGLLMEKGEDLPG